MGVCLIRLIKERFLVAVCGNANEKRSALWPFRPSSVLRQALDDLILLRLPHQRFAFCEMAGIFSTV